MQPSKLKLVSCEGCRETANLPPPMPAKPEKGVRAALAACRERTAELERELKELQAANTAQETRIEELEADLADAEEERQPEGCYAAVERARSALNSARETLRRWKIGVNLKPSEAELAAEIGQMILDLEDLERLY